MTTTFTSLSHFPLEPSSTMPLEIPANKTQAASTLSSTLFFHLSFSFCSVRCGGVLDLMSLPYPRLSDLPFPRLVHTLYSSYSACIIGGVRVPVSSKFGNWKFRRRFRRSILAEVSGSTNVTSRQASTRRVGHPCQEAI